MKSGFCDDYDVILRFDGLDKVMTYLIFMSADSGYGAFVFGLDLFDFDGFPELNISFWFQNIGAIRSINGQWLSFFENVETYEKPIPLKSPNLKIKCKINLAI